MSKSVPLTASVQVVLNGSGNGSVSLGPLIHGVVWKPSTVAVVVNPTSSTLTSQFKLYLGNAQPNNLLGGTYSGDINSDDIHAVVLHPGQILTGVWSGGNPGATATMTIIGTQEIPS